MKGMENGLATRRASIRRSARKYGTAGIVSLRSHLAYPAVLAGNLLSYGLFVFVFSRVWAAVYSGRAEIAGYDRAMIVWYFIVAEIATFGFGRFYQDLSQDMKSGQVAYLLARPYGFTAYHYAQAMGPALADCAVLAAEGTILGLLVAGPFPVASIAQAAAVIVSLLLAGSLQFLFQFAIAMTAFWLEENAALFWIFQKLSLIVGTFLPIEFLPGSAQVLARWTPFPYLSWASARITMAWRPEQALRILAAQGVWVIAAALLCRAVFSAGRDKITVNGG